MSGLGAPIPTLRVELEGMRYQVVHALLSQQEEIAKVVEEEVGKQLSDIDFSAIVEKHLNHAVDTAVRESIERYFLRGAGRSRIEDFIKVKLEEVLK